MQISAGAFVCLLVQPHAEPDVATAAAIGTEREGLVGAPVKTSDGQAPNFSDSAAPAEQAADRAAREAELSNTPAIELLRKLPGVTAGNFRGVMAVAGSLAGLARLSVAQLVPAMGAGNAAILHRFLHTRHVPGL